jgi:DNA adenine methylase
MAKSSTSYPAAWRSGKTTVIRVPEKLVAPLLAIARRMDQADSAVLREDEDSLVLEFAPVRKEVRYSMDRPVNVASVPQRSPFRYPGGKTWLVPQLRAWLKHQRKRPAKFVEPFAGGAIASLTAGFERLAKHVIFAEMDGGVGSVWRVILNGEAEWLANRISAFDLTLKNVRETLDATGGPVRNEAFRTILRNRVQRGGIMASGAGLIKTGEAGRGLNARWYPATLARRIVEINAIRDRFTFVHGDGLPLVRDLINDDDAVFYIDPPYLVAARRLYSHWQVDHREIFRLMSKAKGDFLMSYDNTPEIRALAEEFQFQTRQVAMKNTHHARMTELLIGRDLSWTGQASV